MSTFYNQSEITQMALQPVIDSLNNPGAFLSEWESLDLGGILLGVVHGKMILTIGGVLGEYVNGQAVTINSSMPMSINSSLLAAYELNDGEVLLSAAGGTELWKSTGWQSSPATATWSKVLEAETYATGQARFHQGWSVRVREQYVLAVEYGNPKPNAHLAYLSTNHGATWETIFDQRDWNTLDSQSNAHMHGGDIDIWHDGGPRIYLQPSDTPYQRILYSDDLGDTWQAIADEDYPTFVSVQDINNATSDDVLPSVYVIMNATPWGIAVGQDDWPEGVGVILRDVTYTNAPKLRHSVIIAETLKDNLSLQYVSQAACEIGEWVINLHNPASGVVSDNLSQVSPKLTAVNTRTGLGLLIWEGPKTMTQLRAINFFNGALWVRNNTDNSTLRIPLYQTRIKTTDSFSVSDTGNVNVGVSSANRNAVSIGFGASALRSNSIAVGYRVEANSRQTVIGGKANVVGSRVICVTPPLLGTDSTGASSVAGNNCTLVGQALSSVGDQCTLIGEGLSNTDANFAVIVGSQNSYSGSTSGVLVGRQLTASGAEAVAIGRNNSATGSRSIAIGASIEATATECIALGRNAKSTHNRSVAIGGGSSGQQAETTAAEQFHIGTRFLQMAGFTSARATPPSGQVAIWYRSDLDELHIRLPSGTVRKLSTEAV